LQEVKNGFHKVISRMGVATESNYSILKVKSSNTNVQSKIATRPVKQQYKDPNVKSPFEKNLQHFFDSSEA